MSSKKKGKLWDKKNFFIIQVAFTLQKEIRILLNVKKTFDFLTDEL